MKICYKLLIVFLILLCFWNISFAKNHLKLKSNDMFYPTQKDMLNVSKGNLKEVDIKYNRICQKLIEKFKSDKAFVNALKKDNDEFFKYRLIERDVVLPYYSKDSTFYGSNYKLYSDSFLINLTNTKIDKLKKSVKTYCLYNDFLHNANDCSDKIINEIFE